MRRILLAVLAALMLALASSPALAEGHMCRHWYPDGTYGGYWLYIDCPQDEGDGRWGTWYVNLPWYEWNSEYLDIRDPIY